MKQTTPYIWLPLLLLTAGRLNAQSIEPRDCAEIRYQAERTMEQFALLLFQLSDSFFFAREREDMKRNSYSPNNPGRLFFSADIIIEDDLLSAGPATGHTELNDKKADRYLDDFDLFYSKSDTSTIHFTNFHFGPIQKKDYIFLHLLYDSELRGEIEGRSPLAAATYRRVATIRAERAGGQWRTYIQQINYFRPEFDYVAAYRDVDCDGLPDDADACPETPGLPAAGGCPAPPVVDRDKDGLPDPEDRCPDRSGPWCADGCPPPVDAPLFRQVQWEERYGYPGADAAYGISSNERGEVVLAGETAIAGKGKELFLAILDPCRRTVRARVVHGGAQDDGARAVLPLAPGRYAAAGYTESSGSGSRDGWLVFIDSLGATAEFFFGSNRSEDAFLDMALDTAGNLLLTGYRDRALWLLQLTPQGEVLAETQYHARGRARGAALAVAPDGSIYVAGYSRGGSDRLLVLHYDQAAQRLTPLFEKSQARALDLLVDREGQLVVAGACYAPRTRDDTYVLRLSPQGRVLWERAPLDGGTGIDVARSIIETQAGHYLLAGHSSSYAEGARREKLWADLLDRDGERQWPEPLFYGHRFADRAHRLARLGPDRVVAAGVTHTAGRERDAECWLVGLNTTIGNEE